MTTSQLELLRDIDWDILLVMDACRWDYWNENYGSGIPIWSLASCTKGFIDEFSESFDLSDVTCVTANPIISKRCHEFDERVDFWEDNWRYFNGIGTVSPKDVSDLALNYVDRNRLYIHYIQPHGPYPFSNPPVPVMRANPQAGEVKLGDDMPDSMIENVEEFLKEDNWLTKDLLREAYRRNLEWVYDSFLPFRNLEDKTVIVTSDHGEWLGEDFKYGHPKKQDDELLRTVPWLEI